MYKNIKNKIKKFNHNYPFLLVIVTAIIASVLGITIQYIINGHIIGTGFYTTLAITIAGLIRIRRQQKR